MSVEMRLVFDSADEMRKFLGGIGNTVLAEEEGDDELDDEETESVAEDSSAETNEDGDEDDLPTPGTAVKKTKKSQSAAVIQVANYYDAVRHLYFFNGSVYGEGAIIWATLPYMYYYDVTFQYNPDDASQPQVVPLDTDNFNRHEPRVTLDYDYRQAFYLAQTKKEPGFVLICRDGKFYIPCTSFYDPVSGMTYYLINLFNVKSCDSRSRELWTVVIVHVGNAHNTLAFQYCRGTEIDWQAAVDYIIEDTNRDQYEVEQVELFDDIRESMIKKEPPSPKASSKSSKPPKGTTASRKRPSQ